jgi:hypothetical protein
MNMMKKYLLTLAAFVAATATFTACSSEEDAVSSAEQEQGVVKTEFTISFPQQMGGFTRQGLDIVQGQATPVFRGLQNIELRPFSLSAASVGSSTTLPSPISLGTTTSTTAGYTLTADQMTTLTNYPSEVSGGHKAHLYKNIEIPIGTRSFMFYGVAKNKEVSSGSANNVNGVLTQEISGTSLGGVSFKLTPICDLSSLPSEATTIANYLTAIATASATVDDKAMTTLDYFPNFKLITTGSWNSVKAVAKQVYMSVKNNTDALSVAIKAAIETAATPSATDTLTFDKAGYSTLTYPANIGLPDGAAYVKWQDTQFVAMNQDNWGLNAATLNNYVYPPSLYYYGLSDIKTVPVSMEENYVSSKTWNDIVKDYTDNADSKDVVQSTTRSIAIVKEMQYAVGRLDVTVATQNGVSTLKDADGNDITIGAGKLPITGILISNQKAVDFEFATTDGTAYTVYDSQMPTGAEGDEPKAYLYPGSSAQATKTHTLVLQTVDATSDDDGNANVKIAVEFLNNTGKTIIGKDKHLIYPGTYFYLIGTLQPYKNYTADNGKTYTNTTTKIAKAFVQDYITTANFKVNSFTNAYDQLPDLRIPSLEIGMSVDLTWQTGISQDITIQ